MIVNIIFQDHIFNGNYTSPSFLNNMKYAHNGSIVQTYAQKCEMKPKIYDELNRNINMGI